MPDVKNQLPIQRAVNKVSLGPVVPTVQTAAVPQTPEKVRAGEDPITEMRPEHVPPTSETVRAGESLPTAAPGGAEVVVEPAFAPVSQAESLMLALPPAQRTAIELLTSGKTLVAAATAVGVTRMTLYRWLKADAAFSAAYNAWQKDILDTARARLLALSDLAVSTVAKSMAQGDARTAVKLLQSLGALELPQPGSTDPDEILRVQKLERMKAQTALRKAETRAQLEADLPM
jgi:hypothetical protein